jgi:uncharacterized protein (TIGR03067 family)
MTGVLKAMWVTKIKCVVAMMLVVGLGLGMIGLGVNLFHDRSQAAELQEVKIKDDLPGEKPAASDKDRLQGEWVIVGIEEDGKQATNSVFQDEAKYHKVIVKGDKLILHAGTEIEQEQAFKLDQSKKVKEIDLVRDGTNQPGVYALKDDLWKMNIAVRTNKRPTGFTAEKGQLLLVLERRAGKAEAKPKEGEPRKDEKNIQGTWRAVRIQEDGRINDFSAVPRDDPSTIVYFAGDKWIAGNGTTVFTFKLDSSKSPKTIDLQKEDGSKKTIRGTYELNGDNLKICVCYTSNASNTTLYVFKRANPQPDDKKAKPKERRQDGSAKTDDFTEGDYRKLQGDWKVVGFEEKGKITEGDGVAHVTIPKWTIDGNTISVVGIKPPFEGGGPITWKIAFKLDSSKTPKKITLTEGVGENQKKQIARNGIYSLDGDNLKICVNGEGGEAPTKFEAKAGSPNRIFILKRQE